MFDGVMARLISVIGINVYTIILPIT